MTREPTELERELLEACKAQHDAIDRLFAMICVRDRLFRPSKSGPPWDALLRGNNAIAKAERELGLAP